MVTIAEVIRLIESKNDNSCLVLDTSNQWILLGIKSQKGWQSSSLEAPRRCFQILPDLIRKLCQEAKIDKPDWLVSTIGPGSFTGTRLGAAFARNLAQLWQVPVMGIISLEFYAYDLLHKRKDLRKFALMLDAKQKHIYGTSLNRQSTAATHKALFSKDSKKTFPLVDQDPTLFLAGIGKEYQVFADDPQTIRNYIKGQTQAYIEKMPIPEPRYLYELALKKGGKEAASSWAELKPLYLRTMPGKSIHARTHDRRNEN